MAYETKITVHFGDVDPAHIVYYPTIFHYCHIAFEQFFADFVGLPYARLISEERLGFPTVNVMANFHKSIKYGEEVKILLSVARIGKSSVQFQYRGVGATDDETRFEALITTAVVDMESFSSRVLPPKYQEIFARCR
ncbi:MAG: acyl-CoA thioesterase [Acidobacteriota bacterium]